MPSNSKNIYCANNRNWPYVIGISFSESSVSIASNTSVVSISGYIRSTQLSWIDNYNSYVQVYWYDNYTNREQLVASSAPFTRLNQGAQVNASGAITVTHNSDGSLNGYAAVRFRAGSTSGGWCPNSDEVFTANTWLTHIARASNITSISGEYIGNSVTVNIDRKSSSFTHKVEYSFSDSSYTTAATNASTSAAFTPPLSLCSRIPNSTYGSLTVRVTTFNGGSQVGNPSYSSINLYVPSSVVPSMGSPSATPVLTSGVPSSWNSIYIQSLSKVKISINGATGAYGSTIKSYSIVGPGLNSSSSSDTSSILSSTGTLTYTCTITDSRGRTSSKTTSITVIPYSQPSISATAKRCNEDGSENANGTNLLVTISYSIASVNGYNNIKEKSATCNNVSINNFEKDTPFVLKANVIISKTYAFTATITDAVNNVAKVTLKIPTSERILNVNKNKNGIAIGKFSEKAGYFEVGYQSYFEKEITGVSTISANYFIANNNQGLRVRKTNGDIQEIIHLNTSNETVLNLGAKIPTNYAIVGDNPGGGWIQARNTAIVRNIGYRDSNFCALASMKSKTGRWNIGVLNNNLAITHDTDADYAAGRNNAIVSYFTDGGDIQAKRYLYAYGVQGHNIRIGSDNAEWCNYYAQSNKHWFNKPLYVQGDVFASSNYARKLAFDDMTVKFNMNHPGGVGNLNIIKGYKTYLEMQTLQWGAYGVDVWASDITVKNSIIDSKIKALNLVDKMKFYDFHYNDTNEHVKVGFISQQLMEIDDSFVFEMEDENGNKTYNPRNSNIVPVLAKAIQELKKEIDCLKREKVGENIGNSKSN